MDYEKKYNEALERARKLKEMYPQDAPGYIEVFPELAEPEDERIRKGLVKLLTVASEAYLVESTGIKKDSYLAYLEKQKEHHIPWYDYQKSKEAGYTIVPNEEYEQLIKQKEQKPSWRPSEEQMRALDKAIPVCAWVAGKDEISPLISLYEQLKKL